MNKPMISAMPIDAFLPVGIGGTKDLDTSELKLFVGGLFPDQSSNELHEMFSSFGSIREAVVIPDRFRARSRCFGFVTFVERSSVLKVLDALPIISKHGNRLTVAQSSSKPRTERFTVSHGKAAPSQNQMTDLSGKSLLRTINIQQIRPAKLEVGGAIEKDKDNDAESDCDDVIYCPKLGKWIPVTKDIAFEDTVDHRGGDGEQGSENGEQSKRAKKGVLGLTDGAYRVSTPVMPSNVTIAMSSVQYGSLLRRLNRQTSLIAQLANRNRLLCQIQSVSSPIGMLVPVLANLARNQ